MACLMDNRDIKITVYNSGQKSLQMKYFLPLLKSVFLYYRNRGKIIYDFDLNITLLNYGLQQFLFYNPST